MKILEEATEKLIETDPRYVRDCVAFSADQFEQMSDNGTDSYYGEPARKWNRLVFPLENIWTRDMTVAETDFNETDLWWIAVGILWWELNSRSEN